MIEIAVLIFALAFALIAIYLAVVLKKVADIAGEAEKTLATLTSDLNVTLYQTNELLAKTNILVEDVNGKVATLDPLFVAVADLSESVSDMNSAARDMTVKAKNAGKNSAKIGGVLTTVKLFSSILGKKGEKHG